MTLAPGRRRAEQLAELLDSRGRTDDPVLEPYLAIGAALRAVPAVPGPAPEFRSALRQRLVAVAAVQGVGATAPTASERLREVRSTWRFQRRMAVVAGGAAAATAIAGVGLGASKSLPGDAFYGLKRATEDVQLAATIGQEAKGKRHLEFARTRLAEVEALTAHAAALPAVGANPAIAAGPAPQTADVSTIDATLRDMDAQTRAGAADLIAVYRQSGDREPLAALNSFSREQFSGLRDLLPALPSAVRPHAEASLSLLAQVAGRTVQLSRVTARPTTPAESATPGPTATSSRPQSTKPAHHKTPGGSPSSSTQPSTSSGSSAPGVPTAPATIPPVQVPTVPVPTVSVPPVPTLPTSLPSLPTSLPSLPDLPSLG